MDIKGTIDGYLATIRDQRNKKAVIEDILLPGRIKNQDQRLISIQINELSEIYNATLPYIKKIKEHVEDITEKSKICATYLLLGHIFNNWKAIFVLAENGMNIQMMNIVRSIKESLAIIDLIILDKESDEILSKWFRGEIIQNRISRDSMSGQMEEGTGLTEINFYKILTDIYSMESIYTHSSYVALLESVDIFIKDFDFLNYSNFHFTKTNLGYVKGTMGGTILRIKLVYLLLLNDLETTDGLEELLDLSGVGKTITKDSLECLKKYRKTK